MPFWLLPNYELQQCIVSHILLLYVVIFLNLSTMTAWDIGDMFICGKYQIFCVSSSLGIRFEFQPTQIGVVFLPSVSISAIYIISFFHASDSFSSIRSAVKICFGLSKRSISGLLSFGFILYDATSSPLVSYVRRFVCISYSCSFQLPQVLSFNNQLLKLNFSHY